MRYTIVDIAGTLYILDNSTHQYIAKFHMDNVNKLTNKETPTHWTREEVEAICKAKNEQHANA